MDIQLLSIAASVPGIAVAGIMDFTFKDLLQAITQVGAPGVLAAWLFIEVRERKRLQRRLEQYLYVFQEGARSTRALNKMIRGGKDEDEDDGEDGS